MRKELSHRSFFRMTMLQNFRLITYLSEVTLGDHASNNLRDSSQELELLTVEILEQLVIKEQFTTWAIE